MEFSRQECWSGLPFPSPGDLPNPRIKPRSPALQADALTPEPPGQPFLTLRGTVKFGLSALSPEVLQQPADWCPCPVVLPCSKASPSCHREDFGVQSFSCVWLFGIPWIAAHQVSLTFAISWSFLTRMSTESVIYHPTTSTSAALFSFCFSFSQHEDLFQWVSSSYQEARVLELQPQHQSFQRIFRVNFPWDWLFDLHTVQETLKILLQHHSSKSINFSVLSFLYGTTLTPIHDYWKNHSFHYMDCCQKSNVSAF